MHIVTVSTIKDTVDNIQEFVDLNITSGVNHLFIFLDGGNDAAVEHFKANPYVTCINADDRYWNNDRPQNLNGRQSINATTVNFLLSILNFRCWLFHIDGDECLSIDVEKLNTLPSNIDYVRLMPMESVADSQQTPKNKIDYFKRLLTDEELSLLTLLHKIDSPSNKKYYKGHIAGKVGLIPEFRSNLRIHNAEFLSSKKAFKSPWLSHLHFDSLSLEGFHEKWIKNSQFNTTARVREDRALVRDAMFCLSRNKTLDSSRKSELIKKIYLDHIQDDKKLLMELGLLKARHQAKDISTPLNGRDVDIIRNILAITIRLNANKRIFTLMDFKPREKLVSNIHKESSKQGINVAYK